MGQLATGSGQSASLSSWRTRSAAAVLFFGLGTGCGAHLEADDFGTAEQAIQRNYVVFSQTSTNRWVNLLYSHSFSGHGRAVGAVIVFRPQGYWGNCGATFISPSYAVTAAHCVNGVSGIWLQHYNTTNLSTSKADAQAIVSGTWSTGWTHSTLTSQDGYAVTQFACTVEVGCHSAYIRTPNCPITDGQVDIALIKCPGRKTNATYKDWWVEVHPQDLSNAEVETWWFHEVFHLATQSTGTQPGPTGNWTNYGSFASAYLDNYHYKTAHQYLPLRSSTWPNGTPYKQVGHYTGEMFATKTNADIPVCHGMSGSGVLARGSTQLFGPALNPGSDSSVVTQVRLCEDMPNKNPGQALMRHARRTFTAQLRNMEIVGSDF